MPWMSGGMGDENTPRRDVWFPDNSSKNNSGKKKEDGCPLTAFALLAGATGVIWEIVNIVQTVATAF